MNTAPPKSSRPPLRSLDEALKALLAATPSLPTTEAQRVATVDALGRVLADDVCSALDVPPADATSMDGYALRCADVSEVGVVLPLSQRIAAGEAGAPLQAGTAARIFTGAPVPLGADAIVMQEHCVAQGGGVRIDSVPVPGQWIRRRGEDVAAGSVVLPRGTRLTPQALGLAASVGAATLPVMRRLRVALLSTGNELVMPGAVAPEHMPPGAIYNSNRFTLRAMLEALGCEVSDLGIVPDKLDATRAALRQAAHGHDLIVTSGGVSMGEEDHLRAAVQAEGRLDLWQIAIKPGKPLAFGVVRDGPSGQALLVGLPGNPVSSFVTFALIVRPVLLKLLGVNGLAPRCVPMRADFDWPHADARREFLRVRLNTAGGLELFPNQSSGVLTSAVWADGLVDNPPNRSIARGDAVAYLPLSELLS